jgi:hypothetical protein
MSSVRALVTSTSVFPWRLEPSSLMTSSTARRRRRGSQPRRTLPLLSPCPVPCLRSHRISSTFEVASQGATHVPVSNDSDSRFHGSPLPRRRGAATMT